jgi:hypothetical protein
MNRSGLALLALAVLAILPGSVRAEESTRAFQAPVDRVWTVTRSTLKSLGWDIDKEDRDLGRIRTDSRRVEGDNFGVYEKALRHRLRIIIDERDGGRTEVTVERRLYKSERVLVVDKEEDIPLKDRDVEKRILDAIGRSL